MSGRNFFLDPIACTRRFEACSLGDAFVLICRGPRGTDIRLVRWSLGLAGVSHLLHTFCRNRPRQAAPNEPGDWPRRRALKMEPFPGLLDAGCGVRRPPAITASRRPPVVATRR